MKRKFFLYAFCAFFAFSTTTLTSCLDFLDDDEEYTPEDEDNNTSEEDETAVELPIPASIVDGVRVQELSNDDGEAVLSISYNDDGSINNAIYDGTEYEFEYATDARATSTTGRKLKNITARSTYTEDHGQSHYKTTTKLTAYNFKFNTDGFLVYYKERGSISESYYEINEGSSSSYETINGTYTLAYNSAGRLEHISASGTTTETITEDGETYTEEESSSGTVKYSYVGGSLEQMKIVDEDDEMSYNYEYENSLNNTYNVVTPQLAEGMASFSPVLYILAQMGYLGNASSLLPTKLTFSSIYTDDDGDTDVDTESYTISYNFWETNNKIRSITTSRPGQNPFTYTYGWTY